jgi:hypothetical protein|nr:MAG TPA: hypothetical protein [Caudoviricetes sp.]
MKRIKFLPLVDDLAFRYKVVNRELIPMLDEKASPVPIKDAVQSEKYDWLAIVTKRPVEELISEGYIEIGLVRPYAEEEDSTIYYVRAACLTPCTLQTYKRKCFRVFPSHRIAKIQIAKLLNKSPFCHTNRKNFK